uniref:Uncharacterized protein n=1 Tax=Moniliophthora roreri TaxID=221103 RepID=A0A0W0G0R3_MONRR
MTRSSGNERLETSSVALFDLLVFGAQGPQGTRDGVPEQSNQEILDPVRTLVVDYHPISTISAESAIYVTSSPRAETVSSRIAFTNNHVFLDQYGVILNYTPSGHFPPLSIQTYSNVGTTFNYLTETVPTFNIILGIAGCFRGFWKRLMDKDARSIFQTFSNFYHQHSQNIIAKLPVEARDRPYYYLSRADVSSDAMRESLIVMEDDSVQFTVIPMDIQQVEVMILQYSLSSFTTLALAWITQAHRVFTQLRIDEDKWEEYAIVY